MNDIDYAHHVEQHDEWLRREEEALDAQYQEYFDSLGEPCPACGEFADYCQGHGEIGDPDGHEILSNHDDGKHGDCHYKSDCRLEERDDPFDV